MCATTADRRKHARHPLATSVEFYHEPSRKTFPGRCIDISHGGLMMFVPATAPLQAGHSIRVTVGSIDRPEFANLGQEPMAATVIRVQRHTLLSLGSVAVGIRFEATEGDASGPRKN